MAGKKEYGMESRLLTVMEAAGEMHLCRASIYKLLKSGALSSVLVLDRRIIDGRI